MGLGQSMGLAVSLGRSVREPKNPRTQPCLVSSKKLPRLQVVCPYYVCSLPKKLVVKTPFITFS